MAKVKIRPLDDRVVVNPMAAEEVTAGGIVLPDNAKEKPQRGTVVAVGPGKLLDNGQRGALSVAVGDEVTAGEAITDNPNVGGFGQADAEITLQSPNRVAGLLAFFAIVTMAQIMLVLKKKQVERVQAAEMNF